MRKSKKIVPLLITISLFLCTIDSQLAFAEADSSELSPYVTQEEKENIIPQIETYLDSSACKIDSENCTLGETYAMYSIASLKRAENFSITLVYQKDELVGYIEVYYQEDGDCRVGYHAYDTFDVQAIQAAVNQSDILFCTGSGYWVNGTLCYNLVISDGVVYDLTGNTSLGNYSDLECKKYFSGTVDQNGNNEIANAEKREKIEENISNCCQNLGISLTDGYLSYSYRVISAVDFEETEDAHYFTFLIVNNKAVGCFECSAETDAECTYMETNSAVLVDVMYTSKAYLVMSGEAYSIDGKTYPLLLYVDGVLYDLATDNVVKIENSDDFTETGTTDTSSTTETTVVSDSENKLSIGDINLDGRLDITDAVLMTKMANGSVALNDAQFAVADCNNDGEFNGADALTLLKFLVHLVDALPYSG